MNKDFQILKGIQEELLRDVSLDFQRDAMTQIRWEDRMVGLIGERGVGKTTLMLQQIKKTGEGFYFSADTSIIKIHELFRFVYYLCTEYDIHTFYIDEIHKYPNWAQEIKNIYDALPNARIIFSGSSSLDLYKGVLDLSRRVDFYGSSSFPFGRLYSGQNRKVSKFEVDHGLEVREIGVSSGSCL